MKKDKKEKKKIKNRQGTIFFFFAMFKKTEYETKYKKLNCEFHDEGQKTMTIVTWEEKRQQLT